MRFAFRNTSFFNFLYNMFGLNTVLLLKKWIHHNKELVKIRARSKYLLQCKRSNLVPKHLTKYGTYKLKFYNEPSTRRALFYSHRFISLMLNLEISNNFKQIKLITSSIHYLTRTIERNLPHYICIKFFNTQYRSLSNLFVKEKNRMMKKLIWNILKRSNILVLIQAPIL